MKTVLFLCTGNYYRSRFAELLFNTIAPRQDLRWRAESRGLELSAANEGSISPFAAQRLQTLGIALPGDVRFPLPATTGDFERAAHVVAVKATEHRPLLQRQFPEFLQRVEFWEVHDIDCATPDVALPHLERQVQELAARVQELRPASGNDSHC